MKEFQKAVQGAQFGVALVTREGETLYLNPWLRDLARGDIMDVPKIRDWVMSLPTSSAAGVGSQDQPPTRQNAILTIPNRSSGYSYVHVSALLSDKNSWIIMCSSVSPEEGASALCDLEATRLCSILESIPLAILVVGPGGQVEACTSGVGEIFRLSDEAIVSAADTHPLQFLDIRLKKPGEFHESLERIKRAPDENFSQVLELDDGRFIEVASAPIQDEGGPSGRVWLFRESDEEMADGRQLSTGEIRYRTLFEHFPLGIISCNSKGDVTEINREVWRILGVKPPSPGEPLNVLERKSMIQAGVADAVKQCLESGEYFLGDIRYRNPEGREIFAKLYVAAVQGNDRKAVGAVAVLEDISDQKRAEDLVLHSQRLKVLGQMAGGVTHSFSNHLQVITGNAAMAINNVETESYKDIKPHLEQVSDAAKSAGEIVRRLQLLSREKSSADSTKKSALEVSGVVHEAVEMCKLWAKSYVEKRRISVTYKLDLNKDCYVEANQDDLIEIVLNLLKNAVEALDENGIIRVSVSGDNAHVFIRVRDDGVGIAKKDIDNIVAPFWTSKAGHAGMGLAVNASLVRGYGGGIAIKRLKPRGAIFTVRLPRVKAPFEKKTTQAIDKPERRYRILLIDDDRPVVNILGKGLTRLGNKTFVAFSGHQGLEILEEHEVDAIVCDLGMEGMDGWEVSGEVLSVCVEKGIAKPPFILLTGWAGQLAEDEILYHPHVDRIVEKPITIVNLVEIVRKEIERAQRL